MIDKKTITICLFEDGETDTYIFERLIRKIEGMDYHLHIFSSLEGFQENPTLVLDVDIFFVDYQLGHRNGFEIIEYLQSKGHEGPYVLLTGTDEQSFVEETQRLGISYYLLKSEISAS